MVWWKKVSLAVLAVLVVLGHIALWGSPDYTHDQKVKLTILNAIGWAVIFLPAIGVALWARAHRGE